MNDTVLLGPDSVTDPELLHRQLDAMEKKLHSEDEEALNKIAEQATLISALQERLEALENVEEEEAEDETPPVYIDLGTPGANTVVEHNMGILRPNWYLFTDGLQAGASGTPCYDPIDENSGTLRFIVSPAVNMIIKFTKLKAES